MADLDDLDAPKFTDMSTDEAIELLRQIRLSRRMPDKKVSAKPRVTKPKLKTSDIDPTDALELLRILGELK